MLSVGSNYRTSRTVLIRTHQFGDSQVVPKAKLGEIVQATISSLASPDSETIPNQLVLVAHGVGGDLERLTDLKVSA